MDTRASLLMRIKDARDSRAWSEFDAIYRPMLFRFAKSQGLPDADAEDEVQRCMAAIQQIMSDFTYDPRKGRFKGWLRTMINNRCRNQRRDRQAELIRLQVRHEKHEVHQETPEETFDRLWMEEYLKHGLRALRQDHDEIKCQAFELYVIEERPVKEVCDQLGLTPAQLYKTKWQLTQRLREHLAGLVNGRGSCLKKAELLRYHAGDLQRDEAACVEAHLADCAKCTQRNARLLGGHQKISSLLRNLGK